MSQQSSHALRFVLRCRQQTSRRCRALPLTAAGPACAQLHRLSARRFQARPPAAPTPVCAATPCAMRSRATSVFCTVRTVAQPPTGAPPLSCRKTTANHCNTVYFPAKLSSTLHSIRIQTRRRMQVFCKKADVLSGRVQGLVKFSTGRRLVVTSGTVWPASRECLSSEHAAGSDVRVGPFLSVSVTLSQGCVAAMQLPEAAVLILFFKPRHGWRRQSGICIGRLSA